MQLKKEATQLIHLDARDEWVLSSVSIVEPLKECSVLALCVVATEKKWL